MYVRFGLEIIQHAVGWQFFVWGGGGWKLAIFQVAFTLAQ